MSYSANILRASSICTFAILLFGVVSSVSAQSKSQVDSDFDFPYQAIVRNDDTEIFSGPASVHYATDKVAQGEIVQVYRHDPGGWCAIRPIDGSFSLIPEAAVEITEDGFGDITQDNTQAWVGTRLGSVEKPLWQVKLSAGEEVEILGEASWPSPDGHSTIWYQIAPPSGEFRWVRFADLQTPPTETRPAPDARTSDFALNKNDSRNDSNTDSGFKYDELPSADSHQTVVDEPIQSNFAYVDVRQKEVARPKSNPRKPKRDSIATAPAPSDWQWANNGSEGPQPAKSPRVASRVPKVSQASSTRQPARQPQDGIDFKFRPIGQTATASRKFETPKAKGDNVIRDSAVVPAAYQSSVLESAQSGFYSNSSDNDDSPFQSPEQFDLDRSQWQRGGRRLAQRKQQYEAKYDQFNDQIQIGRSDIEDSFGVRLEELPDHPRSYRDQRNSSNVEPYHVSPYNSYPTNSYPTAGSYPATGSYTPANSYAIENSYPPGDRFASLNAEVDTHPHSTLAEKLTPRLSKIEQHLTNEMLKRPNEWQLADIELAVGQIYSQTTKPVERLQSQRIMDKISKCKVIRNGYTKSFQASGETFGTSVRALRDSRSSRFALGDRYQEKRGAFSSPAGSGSANYGSSTRSARGGAIGSGVNTDFELGTRFDASGWLTELVSEDRNNRPVYVLLNDAGKITHHVAGAPGLNLHRYLKSKVGISGRQGYNNRMKMDHITADGIDELLR